MTPQRTMTILNLGCGTKISSHPSVINIDWSIYLHIKKNPLLYHTVRNALSKVRRERLDALSSSIMAWDLRKGIPFPNQSISAVYHSHFLEHMDRQHVEPFLTEVKRVLKPDGIHRIAVPDMEMLCRNYLRHLQICDNAHEAFQEHDRYISDIVLHMVQREASGTREQNAFGRFIENWLLGDARKRGQTHQWMYDRVNLTHLLKQAGYTNVKLMDHQTSQIPGWSIIGLDLDAAGLPYKPGSIYVEATCN